MRIVRRATLIAAALLLVGCTPVAPVPTQTPAVTESSAASAAPTETAAPAPEDVDPEAFLLEGTPGVLDADGVWTGHYGFFTDDTKAVRCDLYIFSGDSGGVTCGVTPGNEALLAVTDPQCDGAYTVGINFKMFDGNAGITGCGPLESEFASTTKVLADNQTLIVEHNAEQYRCTVSAGTANCVDAGSGASINYGLTETGFVG